MSDFFPEEIIEKILLRLPVKTLIRFTTVCKSWLSLIKSPTFIQTHLHTTTDSNNRNDTHLLLLGAFSYPIGATVPHEHHWLHWDSPEFGEYCKLSHPLPYFTPTTKHTDLRVFGTSNGLVCLETNDRSWTETPALIWNPSVRKIVNLPIPPPCLVSSKYITYRKYTSHGFGYDAYSNDYKVLRVVSICDHMDLSRFTTVVQVYSLAKGTWRSLKGSVVPVDLQAGGSERPDFVNGCLHMLEVHLDVYYNDELQEHRKRGGDSFICYFDLATETFGEMMIPEALRRDVCSISRYGESLALIKENRVYPNVTSNCSCDIWVMKEYGNAESWTFLYNIRIEAIVFGFKRCGEVVLEDMDMNGRLVSRLLSLNPKSKETKFLDSKDCSYYFMDSFVESLVLLDHPEASSYQIYPY